jgi:sterol desaturase/sphingolipid hydroxylase (fatty acid hydroxylase superfamily)
MRRPLAIYGGASAGLFAWAFVAVPIHEVLIGCVIGLAMLPLVEFFLHRYVLHWLSLAKWPPLAEVWRRVHYAHHMEPRDPDVILAQPISAVGLSLVYALLSPHSTLPLAAAAFALFAAYEVVHFACHTDDHMESAYFTKRRQAHAVHHYVDENRNFGITSNVVDAVLGTRGRDRDGPARSPTVRNLGYTGAFAERYPHLRDTPPKV